MTHPSPGAGRFAPSPSGDLHVGNLRTALLAWLFARSSGRRFIVRMEDLDRVRPGSDVRQLADLAAIGLDWDGPVVYQSHRNDLYDDAIDRLTSRGLTYECFCTRREIREAASAPHPEPAVTPAGRGRLLSGDLPEPLRHRGRRAAGEGPPGCAPAAGRGRSLDDSRRPAGPVHRRRRRRRAAPQRRGRRLQPRGRGR